LEEDRNYFWFNLDGERKLFTENFSPGKQVYKEKLLDNGDRWESVLAANIKADNPYR